MLAKAGAESGSFMGTPVSPGMLERATDTVVPDQPGDIVGPYRLVTALGTGGMGTVWRVEPAEGAVQRHVALKLPRTGWSPGLASRLQRECDVLSKLEHPNIARMYDAGMTGAGRPWLSMEIIDGVPVDAHCREKALPVRQRLELFLKVARAISYAHARLVVHRDLKPSNILVDRDGEPHVVDFGLAKVLDETAERQPQLTQALGRTLTPDYASPEQIRGDAMTVATDVYSLGVVLYEMLTGRRPYRLERESPAALEEAIVEADIPAASSQVAGDRALARALRGDLDTILAKALRKDVDDRYATVEAFALDVDRHLRGLPVHARPPSFGYHASRFVRRHRFGMIAAALVAASLLAGLGGTLHQARQAAAERDKALRELRFAEAADEFMRFLLSEQSSKPLPAAEQLQRAERSAALQFAGDPAVRARMQMLIADLYGELADYKRAQAILLAARKSGEAAGDPWVVTQADCVHAALMVATGRPKEGVALFEKVMPAVEADVAADPGTTQVCFSQRSVAMRNVGRGEDSARDAQVAIASLDATRSGSRTNRIFLATNVGDALTNQGRIREAVAIYEKAMVDLSGIGRGGTSAGLLLASNLIVMLTRAGQPLEAVEAYGKIAAGDDPDPPAYSSLAINHARVLFDVGRAAEAGKKLEEGRLEKVRLGDKRGEAFAALTLAGAACSYGTDADRCDAQRAGADALLRPILPPKHSALATLDYFAGLGAMMRGDPAKARPLLEVAVKRYESALDKNLNVVRALAALARAQSRTGEGAAAKATAARAIGLAREAATGYETTAWLGEAYLAQSIVLAEQGDPTGAASARDAARRHLLGSAGPGSPLLAQMGPG